MMLQGTKAYRRVSLISWNVLANCHIFPESYRYVDRKLLSWSHRREKFKQILRSRGADIVCLQEVDRPDDVAQDLYNIGYQNIILIEVLWKTRRTFDCLQNGFQYLATHSGIL